jgi:hypothetical protein
MLPDIIKPAIIAVRKLKPDAKLHNPDPCYLISLIDRAGVSRREAARLLGLSWTGFRNYLRDRSEPLYRTADYRVQFALECLAADATNQKDE